MRSTAAPSLSLKFASRLSSCKTKSVSSTRLRAAPPPGSKTAKKSQSRPLAERAENRRARLTAPGERQSRDDARRARVVGDDEPPPWVSIVLARHGQDADAGLLVGDGADDLADRVVGGHRRV